MKYLILSLTFIFSSCYLQAQSDIQIIKIKNPDRTVSISAINNSDVTYTLKVDITLEGMKLESPLSEFYEIFPGVEKHIATLIPSDTRTHYKINYQASAIENGEKISTEMMVPDITIYTINGNEESTQLRQYLQKNEIPFFEVNVSYSDKTKKVFENMLVRRGIKKGQVKFPVVIIKGEVYYSIDDMNVFIDTKF